MPRGRRINEIWHDTTPRGHCLVFARIGSGRRSVIRTLGLCDDPEVQRFWELWERGEVSTEFDADRHLRQPIDAGPSPEGEADEAEAVDIEAELDLASNMSGKLSATERTRLRAVIYQPTEQTWNSAYSLIIAEDGTTLWQAVIAVDPSFPQRGPATDIRGRLVERWKRVPSQEVLLAALRYATH